MYAICDGQYSRHRQSEPLKSLPEAIGGSFETAYKNAVFLSLTFARRNHESLLKCVIQQQCYWPTTAVKVAETLASESGPYGYPTEDDAEKYTALAHRIVGKLDAQWTVPATFGLVPFF